MWRFIILLPCIFYVNGCSALNINSITLNNNLVPGSYIIQHQGVQGKIVKEASKYIERETRRRQFELLDSGEINFFEYQRRQTKITWAIQDRIVGGSWGNRSWMDSMVPKKGGVPIQPKVYVYGHTSVIFDGVFFTLTNAGDVNFIEYVEEFDLKPDKHNEEYRSGTAWFVKIKPTASFSLSSFADNPLEGLKKTGLVAKFTHFIKHIPMVEVVLSGEYNFHRREFLIYAQIQLLQW